MLTSIGILSYFMSSFQISPYINYQLRNSANTMKKNIVYGSIGNAALVVSAFLYFLFQHNARLDYIRNIGFLIIASCSIIIITFTTREFISQILKENPHSRKSRDRFLTLLILIFTLFLSIFYINANNLKAFLGLGTILTAVLGFWLPSVIYFRLSIKKTEENKKIMIFILFWNTLFGLTVFISGIFIFLVEIELKNF